MNPLKFESSREAHEVKYFPFNTLSNSLLERCRKEVLYIILEFLLPVEIDTVIRRLSQQLHYLASKAEFWEGQLLSRYHLVDLLRLEPYIMAERRSKGRVQRGKMMGTQKKFLVRTVSLETTNAGRDDGVPTSCLREVSLLSQIRHPNLVTCYGAKVEGSLMQIVSEYIESNLSLCLESLSGSHVNVLVIHDLMKQLLLAVQCLHEKGIIHRNIKPDNILLSASRSGSGLELKLADLALARSIDIPLEMYTPEDPKERERSYREQRRLYNRAPEVILRQPIYGLEVDIWSVGCVFLELVLGYPAFRCESEIGLLFSTLQLCGTPDVSIWNRISPSSRLFLKLPIWSPIDFRAVAVTLLNEKTRFSGHLSPYLLRYGKQIESVKMLLKFGSILGINSLHLLERLLIIPGCFRITATEALTYPYFTHSLYETSLHPHVKKWVDSFFKDYVLIASEETLTSIVYYQRFIQYQKEKEHSLLSRNNPNPRWDQNELFVFLQSMEERWNTFHLQLSRLEWLAFDYLKELNLQDETHQVTEDNRDDRNKFSHFKQPEYHETGVSSFSSSSSSLLSTSSSCIPFSSPFSSDSSTEQLNRKLQEIQALPKKKLSQIQKDQQSNEKDDLLSSLSQNKSSSTFSSTKPSHLPLRFKRARSESVCLSRTDPLTSLSESVPDTSNHSSGRFRSSLNCLDSLFLPTKFHLCHERSPRFFFKIHPCLRLHLVNYIFGIQPHFYLKSQTIHLAISYFDRYIALMSESKKNEKSLLSQKELTCVILACLKIADLNNEISKEYYKQDNIAEYVTFFTSSAFSYHQDAEISDFEIYITTQQLLEKEKHILNTLQFDLVIPTLYWFLNALLSVTKLLHMNCLVDYCYYLADLCLYSHQMVPLRPSLKAQVVLLFGCCSLFRPTKQDDSLMKRYPLDPTNSEYPMYLFKLLVNLFTYRDLFCSYNTVWDVLNCVTLMRSLLMHGRRYFELKKIKNVQQKHPWASRIGLPTPEVPIEALRCILPSSQDSVLDSLI